MDSSFIKNFRRSVSTLLLCVLLLTGHSQQQYKTRKMAGTADNNQFKVISFLLFIFSTMMTAVHNTDKMITSILISYVYIISINMDSKCDVRQCRALIWFRTVALSKVLLLLPQHHNCNTNYQDFEGHTNT